MPVGKLTERILLRVVGLPEPFEDVRDVVVGALVLLLIKSEGHIWCKETYAHKTKV